MDSVESTTQPQKFWIEALRPKEDDPKVTAWHNDIIEPVEGFENIRAIFNLAVAVVWGGRIGKDASAEDLGLRIVQEIPGSTPVVVFPIDETEKETPIDG